MKKVFILAGLAMALFVSCFPSHEQGDSMILLNGNEAGLPDDLKGIKFYRVYHSVSDYMDIALKDGSVAACSYRNGKSNKNISIIYNNQNRLINVSEIISENDSIIVCKKQTK